MEKTPVKRERKTGQNNSSLRVLRHRKKREFLNENPRGNMSRKKWGGGVGLDRKIQGGRTSIKKKLEEGIIEAETKKRK